MVDNHEFKSTIDSLENVRKNKENIYNKKIEGYADGGYVQDRI